MVGRDPLYTAPAFANETVGRFQLLVIRPDPLEVWRLDTSTGKVWRYQTGAIKAAPALGLDPPRVICDGWVEVPEDFSLAIRRLDASLNVKTNSTPNSTHLP